MRITGTTNPGQIIVSLDPQGFITAIDINAVDLLGHPIDSLLGSPIEKLITTFFAPIDNPAPISIYQQLCTMERCTANVTQVDGQSIALDLHINKLLSADGPQLFLTLQPPTAALAKRITRDWQKVFDRSERTVAICGSDGKTIELANPALAAMFGCTAAALTGTALADLCTPDTRKSFSAQITQGMRSGRNQFEATCQRRSGDLLPVMIDFVTICDEADAIDYCIVYVHDIRERKETEESLRISREFLQAVYDHAPICMAACDLGGRFISVNPALCDMLGYSEQQLLTLGFADITHPDDISTNINWRQQTLLENLKSYQMEKRYIHRDGRIIWAVLVVSWVRDASGKPLFSIAQIFDLETEPGRRLSSAYSQRDNLVREVHHRIKNNLQSVTGLLRRHFSANSTTNDILQKAIRQVEAIAVVHGLQGSAGNHHIRACEVLSNIIQESNKLQPQGNWIQCPPLLESPGLLHSNEAVPVALVLTELITNAIKHHCPLQDFSVEIAIERMTADQIHIVISNPSAELPAAFDFINGKQIGTGLKLVRALLPQKGMHINFDYIDGRVRVTVMLYPPAIYSEHNSSTEMNETLSQ